MKLVLDTNIIIDVYGKREPFYKDSAKMMSLNDNTELFIMANTITDIAYILKKHIDSAQLIYNVIFDLITNYTVIPVDQQICFEALSISMKDYEDAILAQCALAIGADYIITRDTKDFANSPVNSLSPLEYFTVIKNDG